MLPNLRQQVDRVFNFVDFPFIYAILICLLYFHVFHMIELNFWEDFSVLVSNIEKASIVGADAFFQVRMVSRPTVKIKLNVENFAL